MDRLCQPCLQNHEAAIVDYIGDKFTEASEGERRRCSRRPRTTGSRPSTAPAARSVLRRRRGLPGQPLPGARGRAGLLDQRLASSSSAAPALSSAAHRRHPLQRLPLQVGGAHRKFGRRLTEMIGKRYTRTSSATRASAASCMCPFPSGSPSSGQALALPPFSSTVSRSTPSSTVSSCIVVSSSNAAVKNCATGCRLAPNDLSACLETTHAYLDNQSAIASP